MKHTRKLALAYFMTGAGLVIFAKQVIYGVNTGLPLPFDIAGLGALIAWTAVLTLKKED